MTGILGGLTLRNFAIALLASLGLGVLLAINPLIPVGLLVAAAGVWVLVKQPWIALMVLVIILPLNGMSSALFSNETAVTAFGAAKDALLVLLLGTAIVSGRIKRVPVPVVTLVLMIVALGGVSAVWTPNVTQALYGWRNDYLPLLMLIVAPAILEKKHFVPMATLFAFVGQASAVITIVTWNLGLDWLLTLGRLPVPAGQEFPVALFVAGSIVPRGFSPYTAPNESAVATTIVLAVIWCRPGWNLVTKILLSILPLIAIYLTQSRSGYIGLAILAIALLGYYVSKRQPGLLAPLLTLSLLISIVVVVLYLYHDRVVSVIADPSLIGHGASFQSNLPYLVNSPFGVGLGKVGPRALIYSSDAVLVESYILVLAIESGIIVAVLFVALIVYLLVRGLRSPTWQGYLTAAAILGATVSFTVLPTLQEGAVAYTLYLVIGLGLVATQSSRAPRRRALRRVTRRPLARWGRSLRSS